MTSLKYGHSSVPLKFAYPEHWDVANITDVTLTVYDVDTGELLLDETSSELWDGLITDSETVQAQDITLLITADQPPIKGCRYRIQNTTDDGSAPGNVEDFVADSFLVDEEGNYLVSLERELEHDHAELEQIWGCYATFELDVSDTSMFFMGRRLKAVWSPDNQDGASTQMMIVSGVDSGASELWEQLRDNYPSQWESIQDSERASLERVIVSGFGMELKKIGIEQDKVVDQGFMATGRLLYARRHIAGRSSNPDEFKIANQLWQEWINGVKLAVPVIQDLDEDNVVDLGEERVFTPMFVERSI